MTATHAARRHYDFAPGILAIQEQPPSPLPRTVLNALLLLFALMLAWAWFGKLDIIAVAEGKLVPKTYVKIVQPADGGILKEILVDDGDHVRAGQVLLRMDAQLAEADTRILENELEQRRLQLERIDAELEDRPFDAGTGQAPELRAQVAAQYRSHRRAYEDATAEQQAALDKAREDLAAALQVQAKLASLLPTYRQEEAALRSLGDRALVSKIEVIERERKRLETEHDLHAQERNVQSLRAGIAQAERRSAQITSNYRQQLQNERVDAQAQLAKAEQELAKQERRNTLLELKAPQDGVIKDVATHTVGAVVNPGTVLLTLVPVEETLEAEVRVRNDDIGFVHAGQPVKLKFTAYPFQKYGLLEGEVVHVSADADEHGTVPGSGPQDDASTDPAPQSRLNYKAIVRLKAQHIERDTARYTLSAGMQVMAEINQGQRTVLEYLLSPVSGVFHEAWRER